MRRASDKGRTNRAAWSVKSAEGNRTVAPRTKVIEAARLILALRQQEGETT